MDASVPTLRKAHYGATPLGPISVAAGSPVLSMAPASATIVAPSFGAPSSADQLLIDGTTRAFRFLSYNIWGIFNSKYRKQRLAHFGATRVKDYDIICLQEQFSEEDFQLIWENVPMAVRALLQYRRFPSSFIGSGLTVISRFEILSAQFYCFPTQGYPEKVLHGDFFANKGAALVRLSVPVPPLGYQGPLSSSTSSSGHFGGHSPLPDTTYVTLNVYTTHLVAQYEKYSKLGSYERETYAPFRLSQALALANFVCNTSRASDNVIVCGDFNASPTSPEMRAFLAVCQLRGCLEFTRTLIDDDATNFTYSFDNQFNTDSTSYLRFMDMQEDIPVQLDHILFHGKHMLLTPLAPINPTDVSPAFQVQAQESPMGVVVFTNNKEVSTGNAKCPTCPMSDHFGVAARFILSASPIGGNSVAPQGSTSSYPTSGTLHHRASSSVFGVSPHLPQLHVDPTPHRKSIEFASSFLSRFAAGLQVQSTRLMRFAVVIVLQPVLWKLLAALLVARVTSPQDRTWVNEIVEDTAALVCNPLTMFLLGAVCTVLTLLSKIHRVNDSVVMTWQAEDVRQLTSQGLCIE